jgi:hypothetical protein
MMYRDFLKVTSPKRVVNEGLARQEATDGAGASGWPWRDRLLAPPFQGRRGFIRAGSPWRSIHLLFKDSLKERLWLQLGPG